MGLYQQVAMKRLYLLDKQRQEMVPRDLHELHRAGGTPLVPVILCPPALHALHAPEALPPQLLRQSHALHRPNETLSYMN
eukprot:626069-Pelagomonas_calceolata.AAC.11